ncbi:PepSY domain-containing protein [Flavisolibacter sp. BT320]|nr:PepSY domain-containing protein [Flavisolibacter longurius]
MKVFFRRIHLYLSFAAGLVILICCLTGAILVFEKDLMMVFNKDRYYVEATGSRLSADSLVSSVKKAFPEAKVNGIKLYEEADRSAEVSVAFGKKGGKDGDKVAGAKGANEKPAAGAIGEGAKAEASRGKEGAKGGAPQRQPGFTIFVNPYTGQVLDKYTYSETGWYTVFALHRWLLGGNNSIGKLIVGISTLLFLFILITGIILWWPKTVKIMKQRLNIKWGAGWKRINHDMHLVFGFYSAIFLFIFSFTGLAWSFEWFNKGIYTVTNSPMKAPEPPKSTYIADAKRISFDKALAAAQTVYPSAEFYNISAPKDSTEPISVSRLGADAAHESATDAVYIDQYSGAVLGKMAFGERSLGAQVRSAFKPIHTGSIWGTPSKIIAFITCLLGVTFPITGTIMWYNRTRKKAKAAKKKVAEPDLVA